jgi:hypothetical protein
MNKKPDVVIPENGGDFLNDIVGAMPDVSSVADNIASKALDIKQEQIPNVKEGKKRGRPPKNPNAPQKSKSVLGGVANISQENLKDNERMATAAFICGAVEVSGVAIGGDKAIMGDLEKASMTKVWADYLKSKNIDDIPPNLMLALVMSQYYGRVLTTPVAKPKMIKIFSNLKNKFKGWKNARSNMRNDDERKNNARQEDDKEVSGAGN